MVNSTNKPYTVAALRHGGTHLITPIVRKLTGKTVFSPKGNNSLKCVPSKVLVVFTRDPRNRTVSNVRYKFGPGAAHLDADARDRLVLEHLSKMKAVGHDYPIDHMQKWALMWVSGEIAQKRRGMIRMRFEDLVDPVKGLIEVRRLVTFLNEVQPDPLVATAEEALEYSLGKSGTWTGRHSDWREWFGPKSRAFWRANFGGHLTESMGYTNEDGI